MHVILEGRRRTSRKTQLPAGITIKAKQAPTETGSLEVEMA